MIPIRSLEDIRFLVLSVRRQRKLTQAEAAGLIGHTRKWLSDFENGKVNPPADMLLKLLNVLGIKLEATSPSFPETPSDQSDDGLSL